MTYGIRTKTGEGNKAVSQTRIKQKLEDETSQYRHLRHAHREELDHKVIVERLEDKAANKRKIDSCITVFPQLGEFMLANVHHVACWSEGPELQRAIRPVNLDGQDARKYMVS